MPSERPKLQGYIEPEVYQAFIEWKSERGIEKESAALNEFLKIHLGFDKSATSIDSAQIEERVEAKIQVAGETIRESLDRDLRAMIESKLPTKREIDVKVDEYLEEKFKELNAFRVELKSQFAIWNQTLQEGLSKLDSRLQAAEAMLDVKEGVPTLFQEALESVRQQEYVIKQLEKTTLNQLFARIEKVEAIVQPIEGLAEISHPLEPEGVESELLSESFELLGKLPDPLTQNQLTQTELAQRLNCHKSQVSRRKKESNFASWSRGKDPKGIAWQYDRKKERFLPIGAL